MPDPCAWLIAHGSSCAELLGFVSGALCVYLVTRENIWNWPLGVITAAFYIVVFAREGLYSDTGLQVVYLILSLYGWWHWTHGTRRERELARARESGHGDESKGPVVVAHVPIRELLLLAGIGVAFWLLLYAITSRLPGVRSPLLDSALASTSLVAQYMMTRKYVENWLLWIVVDVLYIWLYYTRSLGLTAVLYTVYLALAILGYIQWKRSYVRVLAASS
jgi:nicotinamide mononucleotide transporter